MAYCALASAFIVLVFFPRSAFGAYLYLDPASVTLHRGESATIAVRLDVDEGECVNVVDATLAFGNGLQVADTSRGASILNMWVEKPTVHEDNTVSFAGGIVGGYCGRVPGDPHLSNTIAEIIVRSPGFVVGADAEQTGTTSISFKGTSQVLLDDGKGSQATLQTSGAQVILLDTTGPAKKSDWNKRIENDTIPPSGFTIHLEQKDDAFGGLYFISFNSEDKQSGIDHYEVMEEPFEDFWLFKWGAVDAPWTKVQSPYVLEDQTLNSTIRVRAIDKAGNITVERLVPEVAVRSLSHNRIVSIIVVVGIGLLLAFGIGFFLYRRKKKVTTTFEETHPNESTSIPTKDGE